VTKTVCSVALALVATILINFGDSSLKVVRGSVLTTAFRSEDTPKACALSRLFQVQVAGSISF
jgi:hypothetical protein